MELAFLAVLFSKDYRYEQGGADEVSRGLSSPPTPSQLTPCLHLSFTLTAFHIFTFLSFGDKESSK